MRMRRKPYARPELAACPFCYDEYSDDPRRHIGAWKQQFPHPERPLEMELGCGKGGFIAELARRSPETNFLAVDIKSEVLVLTKRRLEAVLGAVDNVRVIAWEICLISRILDEHDTVRRIYINFCNPWTKTRHQKHRLTHTRQLMQYRTFLEPQGEIWFKTDDPGLFEDSLGYFAEAGFDVIWQCRDLHAQEPAWNIRTEHEEMFSAQGLPIFALIARKGELPPAAPADAAKASRPENTAQEQPAGAAVPDA